MDRTQKPASSKQLPIARSPVSIAIAGRKKEKIVISGLTFFGIGYIIVYVYSEMAMSEVSRIKTESLLTAGDSSWVR